MPAIKETPTFLPYDAEHQGTLNVRTDLGVSFDEPNRLNYLDANVDVFRTDLPNGVTRFDATLEHDPLRVAELYGFLKEVAPAKFFPGTISGVLADWKIVERTSNGYNANLVMLHERLGTSWSDFVSNIEPYIDIFLDREVPSFGEYESSDLKLANAAYAELGSLVVKMLCDGFPEAIRTFNLGEDGEKIERFMFTAIAKDIERRSGHRTRATPQTIPELVRRFQSWPNSRKQDAMRHYFRSIGPFRRHRAINEFGALLFEHGNVAGEDYVYPRAQLAEGETIEAAFLNRRPVRRGKYEIEVMDLKQPDGKVVSIRVKGSLQRVDNSGPTIQPAITWVRDREGHREFVLEQFKDEQGGSLAYHDGVMGVLTVAYLQPETREGWPESMKIPGNGFRQSLGVAQVPVLALMRRDQLVNTDFIEAAEEAA